MFSKSGGVQFGEECPGTRLVPHLTTMFYSPNSTETSSFSVSAYGGNINGGSDNDNNDDGSDSDSNNDDTGRKPTSEELIHFFEALISSDEQGI